MSCLVTAVADDPEEKHTRRWGVRPTVQGWPGLSATGYPPIRTDLITLSDRRHSDEEFAQATAMIPEWDLAWAAGYPLAEGAVGSSPS
jgi:hypothetical protein